MNYLLFCHFCLLKFDSGPVYFFFSISQLVIKMQVVEMRGNYETLISVRQVGFEEGIPQG